MAKGGTWPSMKKGLSSPRCKEYVAEVCAHPRRRRRRSICPISAATRGERCAFCCISLEPERRGRSCGPASAWFWFCELGRRNVKRSPIYSGSSAGPNVAMKKDTKNAAIQMGDGRRWGRRQAMYRGHPPRSSRPPVMSSANPPLFAFRCSFLWFRWSLPPCPTRYDGTASGTAR
jgi:hypothetical protein